VKGWNWLFLSLIAVGAFVLASGGGSPFATATAATYVYEKDDGGVPPPVAAALDKLNRERPGFVASPFEDDTVDGAGETPEQYKVAKDAAKKLPSLVVQAGTKVLKVVEDPKTLEQVMEAVP